MDNLRSQGRCKINFIHRIFVLFVALGVGNPAGAGDLTLLMPEEMVASGFHKQILPRFKFKHRIEITPVTAGDADLALGGKGHRVFQVTGGGEVRLDIRRDSEAARLFMAWLTSAPGKAAIEGFQPDGLPVYSSELAVVEEEEDEVIVGDVQIGAHLVLVHCGRCHVVDERNRMGGIGSTPSFPALRGRDDWSNLFRSFYVENPHPSFTQVEGVTEPFGDGRQAHVAPVVVTLGEIDAIAAYVATLEAKSLGRPIQPN